ncbi:CENP-B N-terminal DNA-binding domain [Popillia japonica]|uniref:CENP-B N-terminal DNA-binding domain n=1 Tax=Popillia japonica TaxID=7064 RepID=A0AAW1JEI2_POPJA
MSKRKHTTLNLQQKREIIRSVDSGESVRSVAVKYSIGKSTVSDICKNKANIMDYVAEDHNLDKRKTLRLSAYPAMEKALYTWFVQERARGK